MFKHYIQTCQFGHSLSVDETKTGSAVVAVHIRTETERFPLLRGRRRPRLLECSLHFCPDWILRSFPLPGSSAVMRNTA